MNQKMNFAKELASLVVANSPDPGDVLQKQFSIRVDIRLFCYLEELAKRSGLSRNAAANQLLKSGLDSFMAELPDEVADQFRVCVELREEAEFGAISPEHFNHEPPELPDRRLIPPARPVKPELEG